MEEIKRTLGKAGPEVPAIGLGCMALYGTYGPAESAIAGARYTPEVMARVDRS